MLSSYLEAESGGCSAVIRIIIVSDQSDQNSPYRHYLPISDRVKSILSGQ